MDTNYLLRYACVLPFLLFGRVHQAFAQQDESWYKKWELHHQKTQENSSKINQSKSTRTTEALTTTTISSCDVGINGDFETYRSVASRTNNMGGANDIYGTGVTYAPDQLSNWYSPSYGSPDYFATNATANSEVQPNNENGPYGSFTPYSPIGAIGLYTRLKSYNDGVDRDKQSEYATTALPKALVPAARYYADLQVSLSHKTQYSNATNYGIKQGFGLMFTNSTPRLANRTFIAPTGPTVLSGAIDQSSINYGITGAANWKRISGQFTANGEQYITVGLFNSDDSNGTLLPNGQPSIFNTYFFVDDIRLFKIPTAGPGSTTCGGPITMGEGCLIPDATYTWSAPGITGLPTNSSSISLTTSPKATTTYTLTVTLPDKTTYSTTVTIVVVAGPEMPLITVDEVHTDRCQKYIGYVITNFNRNFTYTVNIISGRVNALPANPTTNQFRIKGGDRITGGSFSVTVSCGGNSVTTSEYFADFDCASNRMTQASTAYPNPAAESVTLPEGVEHATLLDNNGKIVKSSGKSDKLDIRSLPDGLYNLQMFSNGKLINQRIQVKH